MGLADFTFEQLRPDLVKGAAITRPGIAPDFLLYRDPWPEGFNVNGDPGVDYFPDSEDMQRTDWTFWRPT